MNRMAKMKTKVQRTDGAVVPTSPASVLNDIIDKYAKKDLGGQERSIKSFLLSTSDSEISSVTRSYIRAKMSSTSAAVRTPNGIAKISEIPKQEYKPLDTRTASEPAYKKILERIMKASREAA